MSCNAVSDKLTILVQDIQTLLYQQGGIEHNQAVADREHVIARPRLEKSSNGSLASCQPAPHDSSPHKRCHTRPSSCSRSMAES